MSTFHSGSTRPHTLEDQVQYFESEFGELVKGACQDALQQEMNPSVFLSCITCLPVSARPIHESFILERLTHIPAPLTFESIWLHLNTYWDFLNYGLLEHVITNFGGDVLKWKMQRYVQELSTFKQTTRFCDFVQCKCKRDTPLEENLKKVVIKMHHEWSKCTLQDIESSGRALVQKFFLPEFEIILQKAERGCVCVTWLTSPSTATLLQQNLANIETEFFKEHSIDSVTVDGQDIYLTPVKKYGGYLRELYTSERLLVGVGPPTPTEKLLPFKLARIKKDKIDLQHADHFTKRYIRGDLDDVDYSNGIVYKKSPMKLSELDCHGCDSHQVVLIEGAPGVGKTTFSWEFCKKWGKGKILRDHPLLLLLPLRDNNLKEAKTLSDLPPKPRAPASSDPRSHQ